MLAAPPPESESSAVRALAPRWHTASLIGLIVAVAVAGTLLGGRVTAPAAGAPTSRILSVYAPMLVVQGLLLLYVSRLGRPRCVLGLLFGRRWRSLGRACADVALAVIVALLIVGLEAAWSRTAGPGRNAAAAALLPRTDLERGTWALVACAAGFSEEVVYRGYLQTQLAGFTGSALAALVLQAALFGLAHGEQGPAAMLRIGVYGLLLGALAHGRRSLAPGIVCHVGIDLASALLR